MATIPIDQLIGGRDDCPICGSNRRCVHTQTSPLDKPKLTIGDIVKLQETFLREARISIPPLSDGNSFAYVIVLSTDGGSQRLRALQISDAGITGMDSEPYALVEHDPRRQIMYSLVTGETISQHRYDTVLWDDGTSIPIFGHRIVAVVKALNGTEIPTRHIIGTTWEETTLARVFEFLYGVRDRELEDVANTLVKVMSVLNALGGATYRQLVEGLPQYIQFLDAALFYLEENDFIYESKSGVFGPTQKGKQWK